MYSRDESVDAILKFYQEILCHPYLDDRSLILPPSDGWPSIGVQGKNETVNDLLRHLPYLYAQDPYERLLVHWETVSICYYVADEDDLGNDTSWSEDVYTLPDHCVYLTQSINREGTNLILDTNEGTITEFSHTGAHITVSEDEYEALPMQEQWKAHRTWPSVAAWSENWISRYARLVWMLVPNPVSGPASGRFYSRADSTLEEEMLMRQDGPLKPLDLEEATADDDGGGGNEMDLFIRQERAMDKRHIAVSNCETPSGHVETDCSAFFTEPLQPAYPLRMAGRL